MTAAPPPDFLSVAEAAVILRAYRIGGKGSRVQIDRRDLYTFLRQSRSGR